MSKGKEIAEREKLEAETIYALEQTAQLIDSLQLNKIAHLSYLLMTEMIDERHEGSEPKYRPALPDNARDAVLKKLMQLVKEL